MMDKLRMADAPLIVGLVSSPAWSDLLTNLNATLTTAGLTLGLLLGVVRTVAELRRLIRDMFKDKGGGDA